MVSPEDDVELRRVRITNRSWRPRTIELTSYAEVVIAPIGHDAAHPAFSNLFVTTELLPDRNAILATRRPRSSGEHPPWLVHTMVVDGRLVRTTSFETDRSRFIGRGRTLANPVAMVDSSVLSDTAGSVLDPVVAVRRTVSIEPQETVTVYLYLGVAEDRDRALGLVEKYQDRYMGDRVTELAWTHTQVMLRQLNATETDAQVFARLASAIIYPNPARRAPPEVIARNRRGQSGLWGYGISGDYPLVLVRVSEKARVGLVRQMIQAHAYWRRKGLITDLLFWNEDVSGYRQDLTDELIRQTSLGPDPQTDRSARRRLRPAARPDPRGGPGPDADPWPASSWRTGTARSPSRSSGSGGPIPRSRGSCRRDRDRRRRRRPRSRSTGRPSTTTTGSAASRRTGGST